MTRRFAIAAGVVGAAILAILLGIWLARAPLAGWAVRSVLENRGIEADFDIVRLDGRGAVVRGVQLGPDGSVPLIELDWRLPELAGGRIRAVRLTRPQIRVMLDDEGVQIAGFRVGGAGGGGGAPRIGLVSVTNGVATVSSPAGDLPVELELEGGPEQGWRGWLTAAVPGAVAWRGWRADVEALDAEFEMIGDGLLARASMTLSDIDSARGGAARGAVAATVRLEGLEQGFANATGAAAVNAMLEDARAGDPRAEARRLIAAPRWETIAGAGSLSEPLADRVAAALAGFGAQAALFLDITPETVNVALQAPARIDSTDGPDATLRPLDDPEAGLIFSYGRAPAGEQSRGWRLQAAAEVTGNPELNARVLDIRMSGGLAALRFEGSLAPFGTDEAMIGADNLLAEWQRTQNGWRLGSSGGARFSGAAFGMSARGAAVDGRFVLTREGGVTQLRPQSPNEALTVAAASFTTTTTQFENLSARFVPDFDLQDGEWRIEPGTAPLTLNAGVIGLGGMRLRGVSLAAPEGGVTLAGQGGVFDLTATAPLRVTMAEAAGGGWTARGVSAAPVTGAGGPLLQRTGDSQTFLNADVRALTAQAFAVSNTTFRDIALRDARLSGPVTPEMELDVSAPSGSALLDTLGRTDMALAAGSLSAVMSLAPGAPLSARFAIADGALSGGTLPMALTGARIAGGAEFATPLRADIGIENAVVAAPGERPIIAPATLSGRLIAEGGDVTMNLSGAAQGAPPDSITVALTHDLLSGVGEAHFDIPRIVFTPGGVQPQDLIAPLKGLIADVSGPVEAHFTAEWFGNAMRSYGDVTLDNLDLATRFGPLQDISTRFALSSLAPLLTAAPQTITMGEFNPGIAVESGEVTVSLLPDRKIGLEHATWPFAGGTISVAPFVWDPAEPQRRAELVAEHVNLAQLVSLFNNPSINAAGTVSGRMPILIEDGNIEIENALLTGDEEGFVSYRGQASDAAAQANEQANLAFRALENLQYRVLEVTLNGPVAGEMELVVTIEGFNPDVLQGVPFRFRIALAAEFMRLIRDTTQGFRIRQQIERSLSGEAPAGERERDGPPDAVREEELQEGGG